jgi:DNA-binding CsgD family transcriptional regulator
MMVSRSTISRETLAAIAKVKTREQFSRCLRAIGAEVGATHYLLLAERHVRGASQPHVVASNWVFDTVQEVGADGLARLARTACALVPPAPPAMPRTEARKPDQPAGEGRLRALLRRHGHGEIHALPLRDAARRCHVFLSAPKQGAIDPALLPTARLACCYLLARPPEGLLDIACDESLSERERECLYWVAEGKTAGEVAMIVGVTANTVNSYLNNAIRKVGASNRAMAIATAIRAGVI